MAGVNTLVLSFVISCYISASRSLAQTPMVVWTNDKNAPKSTEFNVPLGQSIPYHEIESKYLNKFLDGKSGSTIVFLQDKLSLDDFTKYRNKGVGSKPSVFENLKKLLGTESIVTLPSVVKPESGASLIATLKKKHNGYFDEVFSSDIDSWEFPTKKLSAAKKNLIVFHLMPVKGSTEAGKITTLSMNDDLIGKFLSQFDSAGKYTAILTSSEPSDIVDQMQKDELNDEAQLKRHLLSVNSSLPGFYNFSDCVYLYTTSIKLSFNNLNQTVTLTNSSSTLSGKCLNNQSSVSILFDKNLPTNVTKFDLRMKFAKLPDTDWTCTRMQVTFSGILNNTKTTDLNLEFPDCSTILTVPNAMSYTCDGVSFKTFNNTEVLTFDKFQLQPFGVQNQRFSNAYDCVTFFTIPILTGLFVSALLISILFGGIIAMMSMSTMDRFDDPKGPTIQVPHE